MTHKCYYCDWIILPNDLSKVIINDKIYFHTACYNHINNVYNYLRERDEIT